MPRPKPPEETRVLSVRLPVSTLALLDAAVVALDAGGRAEVVAAAIATLRTLGVTVAPIDVGSVEVTDARTVDRSGEPLPARPQRGHDWAPHPILGRVCRACRQTRANHDDACPA